MRFRLLIMFLFGALILSSPVDSYCQFTKKQQKELEKQRNKMYKEKVKELKKGGWEIADGGRTLEVALLEHYQQLAEKGVKEWPGEVSRCRSINAGRHAAITNAQTTYANEICAEVEGIATSSAALDQSIPASEIDMFNSEFKKNIRVNLSGIMKESYALVKDNGDSKQYKIIFLIDEKQAGLAQKRALQASAENSAISHEIIKKISDNLDQIKAE